MAIAFSNIFNLTSTAGTTITSTFDIGTPTNGVLLVAGNGNTTTDLMTGITWNGVAMTRLQALAPNANNPRWIYLYILVNPASGSHNLVVSNSSSAPFYSQAIVYSGAAQTGQPDTSSTANAGTGTSFTETLTVGTANSWLIGYASNSQNDAITAGANTTLRSTSSGQVFADSNAGLAVGSHTLNFNASGDTYAGVYLSLAPVATPATGNFFFFL